MRIGNYEHKPSAPITGFFFVFLIAFCSLGTWQLHRAAEKTTLLQAAERAREVEAIAIDALDDLSIAAEQHTQVTVTGTYDGERQFLWDNRVHQGQAGFEVITPVQTDAGLVLVNRGWVAPGRTRQELPDVSIREDRLDKPVTVTGLFSQPSKGLLSGSALDSRAPWPRVLQYFDYDAIEASLQAPMLAGVVQPQQAVQGSGRTYSDRDGLSEPKASSNNATTDAADDKQAHTEFYIANWEPAAAIGPARHYGYAFQWYAMAVALSILFIVYNTKRREPDQ